MLQLSSALVVRGVLLGVVSPDSRWDDIMDDRLKNDPVGIADNQAILAESALKKHQEPQVKVTQENTQAFKSTLQVCSKT